MTKTLEELEADVAQAMANHAAAQVEYAAAQAAALAAACAVLDAQIAWGALSEELYALRGPLGAAKTWQKENKKSDHLIKRLTHLDAVPGGAGARGPAVLTLALVCSTLSLCAHMGATIHPPPPRSGRGGGGCAPKDVKMMDTRAGAINHAKSLGATEVEMQLQAGHASPRTTQRYIRGRAIARAEVLKLRSAAGKGGEKEQD